MKKNLFYCLFAASCAVTALSSCSEDYEPTPNLIQAIEKDVAGDYKGTLSVEVDGISFEPTSQNIVIERSGMNRVDLTISNFSFANMPLGDVTLADCILEKKGDTYTFQRTEELTLADPVGTCPVSSAATIAKEKVEVTLDITVPALNNQKVNVVYEGTRLTGSENTEAKILSFTFDPSVEANAVVISEPVIDEAAKTISFDVTPDGDVTALVPVVTVSEGATLSPASGEAQDFSSPVIYTVLSEDGKTSVAYTVSIASLMNKYDFEEWEAGTMYDDILNPKGWATCNDAVALIKNMGPLFGGITYTGEYPVRPTSDVVSGSTAAMLESVDTKGGSMLGQKIPKVTAGSMFLGTFNAMAAMSDPMATTSFGILYDLKPLKVTGYYKYTPGTDFYNADGVLQADKRDACSMSAVLYEVASEDETLDGSDIYTSDKIVAQAMITDGNAVAEYTPFELVLNYSKEYDPSKMYKFAVIFSASKDGAAYNAAVGSTLYIDNVSIENEIKE